MMCTLRKTADDELVFTASAIGTALADLAPGIYTVQIHDHFNIAPFTTATPGLDLKWLEAAIRSFPCPASGEPTHVSVLCAHIAARSGLAFDRKTLFDILREHPDFRARVLPGLRAGDTFVSWPTPIPSE